MPRENATIKTYRYRDSNGLPTCAIDFDAGEVCEFHATMKFGTADTCILDINNTSPPGRLERRDKGKGLLIPGDWCPLFKHEKTDPDVNDDYMKREDQITC